MTVIKMRALAIVEWEYEIDTDDIYGEGVVPPMEQIIEEDTDAIAAEWWAYTPGADGDENAPGLLSDHFKIEDGSAPRGPLLLMPDGKLLKVERASDEIEAGVASARFRVIT